MGPSGGVSGTSDATPGTAAGLARGDGWNTMFLRTGDSRPRAELRLCCLAVLCNTFAPSMVRTVIYAMTGLAIAFAVMTRSWILLTFLIFSLQSQKISRGKVCHSTWPLPINLESTQEVL